MISCQQLQIYVGMLACLWLGQKKIAPNIRVLCIFRHCCFGLGTLCRVPACIDCVLTWIRLCLDFVHLAWTRDTSGFSVLLCWLRLRASLKHNCCMKLWAQGLQRIFACTSTTISYWFPDASDMVPVMAFDHSDECIRSPWVGSVSSVMSVARRFSMHG